MSYKETFKLKQQTPMIHFQYDQQGACLRGSELKPKLDKFLIKKKGNVPAEWYLEKIINPEHAALDYKVRIIAKGTPAKSKAVEKRIDEGKDSACRGEINQMYFGNMAKNGTSDDDIRELYKETLLYKDPIELEILCLVPELMEYIKANIEEFFAVTNFGTRQSKGFGCFSILNGNATLKRLNEGGYDFFYTTIQGSIDEKMNIADAIYSAMKGGKNYSKMKGKDAYIKGYIQRAYLDEHKKQNTGSDKAFMKSHGLLKISEGQKKSGYREYEFVRALLGLADHYGDNPKKPITISGDVKRYKSPITIKIVDSYIFFIVENTFAQIKGQVFRFSLGNIEEEIRVPDEFDIDGFITGFIKYYDANKRAFSKIGKPYEKAAGIKLMKGGQ